MAMGIVYIDEVDKIRGLGVQHAQGTVATMPPQSGIDFGTTHVLFICGGAFVGLKELIAKRLGRGGFGFGQLAENRQVVADGLLRQVKPEDLDELRCGSGWQSFGEPRNIGGDTSSADDDQGQLGSHAQISDSRQGG
jgi:ATP-dependent protease Clp ATPase subunit